MEPNRTPIARILHALGETLLYPTQPVMLGRSGENDIVLDDPKVSRSHAILEWNGLGFTVRDLDSINGTYVNGQRLSASARLLRDGDEIILNEYKLSYEIIRAELHEPPLLDGITAPAEPLVPKGPRLMVTAGPDLGQEYPLWGEVITIGRASREATWEIRLTDRSVSRPHARLEMRAGQLFLVDLESANGTRLNGALLKRPVPVREGDQISIGETCLLYRK
jgi:pSer/pThr/pTyr-binding forkhead associated (FHA) protein